MADDATHTAPDPDAEAHSTTGRISILGTLTQAVDAALNDTPEKARDDVRGAIDDLESATIRPIKDDKYGGKSKPAGRPGAPGGEDPELASMKAVRNVAAEQDKATLQSVTAAQTTFDLAQKANARAEEKSCGAARSALIAARDTWSTAREDYEHDIDTAATTLNAALDLAAHTYATKHNRDSQSRDQVVFYGMEADAATALQAYQGTAAGEGATLAAAAGTLLTAYVTYMTAVETAHAQRMHDDAVARQTFWTTVEGLLDAP